MAEFERNLREFMSGLKEDNPATVADKPKGARRSERPKKPSMRFNEISGYLLEPPRSTKTKVTQEESSEGTPAKPLLISNWSNA